MQFAVSRDAPSVEIMYDDLGGLSQAKKHGEDFFVEMLPKIILASIRTGRIGEKWKIHGMKME